MCIYELCEGEQDRERKYSEDSTTAKGTIEV
jgi:hypothetical protein